MPLPYSHELVLERFIQQSDFSTGAVILDLDGTALLEDRGKIFISGSVETGLKDIGVLRRPIVLNTLRFPLSVIGTIAREWLDISGESIPAILLNGSQLGFISLDEDRIVFIEEASFTLSGEEVDEIVDGVQELVENNIRDIILFYYPRDWREGEVIWTPERNRMEGLQKRYVSATEVISGEISELRTRMHDANPCMSLVLVDRPGDTLMAYQHSRPCTFYTHQGVDKTSGTLEMARILGISLADSFGAGNALMDTFLDETGLAVIVGSDPLPYHGKKETLVVRDPIELGEMMSAFARLARSHTLHIHS